MEVIYMANIYENDEKWLKVKAIRTDLEKVEKELTQRCNNCAHVTREDRESLDEIDEAIRRADKLLITIERKVYHDYAKKTISEMIVICDEIS